MNLNIILVVLNYPRPKGLLKIATDLAHKTGAELKALYVEDRSWFEASSFSFSKQITGFRGEIMPLTEEQLTQQSRALSSRFEQIFASYSKSLHIRYSYHTLRGQADEEYSKLISDADLVIMSGNLRTVEYKDEQAEDHKTPALIWSNGADWPKEIIGLCLSPEQSYDVTRWTVALGKLTQRKTRLFWSEEFQPSEEWMVALNKGYSAAPIVRKEITDICEIHSPLGIDFLRHYRSALFVVRRKDLRSEFESMMQELANPILLL